MGFSDSNGMMKHLDKQFDCVRSEDGLSIKEHHYELMLEDVAHRAPNEACGIIAGRDGCSEKIFMITNTLNSPTRFRMAPEEQLNAFNEIEELNLELLAIYHSHPVGPVKPSATDIDEFAYPGTKYLIWSPEGNQWICHAYRISDQEVIEVPLIIIEE
jgi:[CysO sulfur-carrier protein]-S-L-cysteine hydrolase